MDRMSKLGSAILTCVLLVATFFATLVTIYLAGAILLTSITHHAGVTGAPVLAVILMSIVGAGSATSVVFKWRSRGSARSVVNREPSVTKQAPLSARAKRKLTNRAMPAATVAKLSVVIALCMAILIVVTILSGLTLAIVLLIVAAVPVFIWLSIVDERQKAVILRENQRDFNVADSISQRMSRLLTNAQHTLELQPSSLRPVQQLRLGEIARHFDSQTTASIEGWLDHNLGVQGYGVALQVGRVGIGLGRIGVSGQSDVHLSFSGTTRDNLLGDGFIAVFEQDLSGGGIDTLRVIVPSDPASRDMVTQFATALGRGFGEGSHTEGILAGNAALLAKSFHTNVSYISDRLNAVLRMPAEQRPMISVVGAPITEHALLGGALQFAGDNTWYQLFPVVLIEQLTELVAEASGQEATSLTQLPAR